MGVALLEAFQTQKLQKPLGSTAISVGLEAKAGVLPSRQVREQRIVLKQHPNLTSLGRQPTPRRCDLTTSNCNQTLAWPFKTSNQSQQRCFATTRWAKEAKKLTCLEGEINVLQGPIGTGVAMPKLLDLKEWCQCQP